MSLRSRPPADLSAHAASMTTPESPAGACATRTATPSNAWSDASPITPSRAASMPGRGLPSSVNRREPITCGPRIAVSSTTASTRSASTRSASAYIGSTSAKVVEFEPIRSRPLRVGRGSTESARKIASPAANRPLLAPSPARSTKAAWFGTATSGSTIGPPRNSLRPCAGLVMTISVRKGRSRKRRIVTWGRNLFGRTAGLRQGRYRYPRSTPIRQEWPEVADSCSLVANRSETPACSFLATRFQRDPGAPDPSDPAVDSVEHHVNEQPEPDQVQRTGGRTKVGSPPLPPEQKRQQEQHRINRNSRKGMQRMEADRTAIRVIYRVSEQMICIHEHGGYQNRGCAAPSSPVEHDRGEQRDHEVKNDMNHARLPHRPCERGGSGKAILGTHPGDNLCETSSASSVFAWGHCLLEHLGELLDPVLAAAVCAAAGPGQRACNGAGNGDTPLRFHHQWRKRLSYSINSLYVDVVDQG